MTPVTFSKSESCILQVQQSKSNFLHRGMCSPLDGVIGRRESSAELGERSDKVQRGANARATPGWPASSNNKVGHAVKLQIFVRYPFSYF